MCVQIEKQDVMASVRLSNQSTSFWVNLKICYCFFCSILPSFSWSFYNFLLKIHLSKKEKKCFTGFFNCKCQEFVVVVWLSFEMVSMKILLTLIELKCCFVCLVMLLYNKQIHTHRHTCTSLHTHTYIDRQYISCGSRWHTEVQTGNIYTKGNFPAVPNK